MSPVDPTHFACILKYEDARIVIQPGMRIADGQGLVHRSMVQILEGADTYKTLAVSAGAAYDVKMAESITGLVEGGVIKLDTPLKRLEGKRVRLILESEDEDKLEATENQAAWCTWVAQGPQGPIEDDSLPEFP